MKKGEEGRKDRALLPHCAHGARVQKGLYPTYIWERLLSEPLHQKEKAFPGLFFGNDRFLKKDSGGG